MGFRNCIAIAFPNLACPGIHAATEEGDTIECDVRSGRVRNLTRGVEVQAKPYTTDMLTIIERGGLLEVLKRRLAAGTEESR